MDHLKISLSYDMRNPDIRAIRNEPLYQQYLDQMVWAESLGFDGIWFAESHFSKSGEIPSVLLACAALVSRTRRLGVGTDLLVLPLHHPVRLAEDAAFLSILSQGRFTLGVGAGSHEQDFAAFQHHLKERPSLVEESIAIMRKCWSGEAFSFSGKRWTFPEIQVRPLPSDPSIPIYMGGFSPPAIERAARIADGFLCGFERTAAHYLEALDRVGKDRADGRIIMNQWAVIAEDPEREWAHVGPIALRQLNNYVSEGLFGDIEPFADPADVLARGPYKLWDGALAVRELKALKTRYPQLQDVVLFPQIPGETIEHASPRLEYIAAKVLPALRQDTDP